MKFSIVIVVLCLFAVTQARYYRRQQQDGQSPQSDDEQGQQSPQVDDRKDQQPPKDSDRQGQKRPDGGDRKQRPGDGDRQQRPDGGDRQRPDSGDSRQQGKSNALRWAEMVMEHVNFINCLLEHDEYDNAKQTLMNEMKDAGNAEDLEKDFESFENHVKQLKIVNEEIEAILNQQDGTVKEKLDELAKNKEEKDTEKKKIHRDLETFFQDVPVEDFEMIKNHFEEQEQMMTDCHEKLPPRRESQESEESTENETDKRVLNNEIYNMLKSLLNKRK